MAEALISALIEGIASMSLEGIEEELSLVKSVEEDVRKLKANLEAIQPVLEDAEKKQLADLDVKNWLDKLKDVSCDMDNMLDEWNTAILQAKIKEEVGEEVHVDDRSKKVCFSVPSLFSCFRRTTMNQLPFSHVSAHKVKVLNERLDAIAVEKDRYKLDMITTVEQPLKRPRTTNFPGETEIHGRDEEKDFLLSKLLSENNNCRDKELHIIPIVGMGGLGKTTLAQMVYNDEKVKDHFEERIWVCVSDPFVETKVAIEIIRAVEGKSPYSCRFETLLQLLRKFVEGKRFLLVLDDVRIKDNKWEHLEQSLKYGSIGSRVLVTARQEEVALMMGATSRMIRLEKLPDEHCWLVFKRLAFFEREKDECQKLEEIGRKIASNCKGLPLVAKMLGSMMRFKKTRAQWESVMNSEWWKFKGDGETFAPFLLSYHDLSAKEKFCFSYCSIFRKDDVIWNNS